jgi:hypothetical protein
MLKLQMENKNKGLITTNLRKILLKIAAVLITSSGLLLFGCDEQTPPVETTEVTQTADADTTPYTAATLTETPPVTTLLTPTPTAVPSTIPSKEELAKKLSDDIGIGDAPIFVSNTIVVNYLQDEKLKTVPCIMYLTDSNETAILANVLSLDPVTEDYIQMFKVPNADLIFSLENGTSIDSTLFEPLTDAMKESKIKVQSVLPLSCSGKDVEGDNGKLPYGTIINDINGFLLTRELAEYWVNAYDYSRLVFQSDLIVGYANATSAKPTITPHMK